MRTLDDGFGARGERGSRAGLILLPLLLLLAGLMVCVPALAADPIGEVDSLEGECRIIRGGETLAAELQQPVMLNDEIDTCAGGHISILFLDETILTLDESSHAAIDDYMYSEDAANLLFKFTKGTFRAITGEIVKRNPEGFNMETPMVTIGIRGSDVYAVVRPGGEEAGALHLGAGHALEIKSPVQTVRITRSGLRVHIAPGGVIAAPTRIPASMLNNMMKLGSSPDGSSDKSGTKRTLSKKFSRKTKTLKGKTLEGKSGKTLDGKSGGTSRLGLDDLKSGQTGGGTTGGTTGGATGGRTGSGITGGTTGGTTGGATGGATDGLKPGTNTLGGTTLGGKTASPPSGTLSPSGTPTLQPSGTLAPKTVAPTTTLTPRTTVPPTTLTPKVAPKTTVRPRFTRP